MLSIFTGCRKNEEEDIDPITFTLEKNEFKGSYFHYYSCVYDKFFSVPKDGFYYIELSKECTFNLNDVSFKGNKTGMFLEKDKKNYIRININQIDNVGLGNDDITATVTLKK